MTLTSAATDRRPLLPPSAPIHLRRAATWAFVLPALFGYVRMPNGRNHVLPALEVGLSLLFVAMVVAIALGVAAQRDLNVIAASAILFSGLFVAYLLAWPYLKGWAFADPDPKLAASAVLYCCAAVVYGRLFYHPATLIDVFWKGAIVASVVAVAAYGLNSFTDSGWLVHRQYGTPRLQGFLSEPSGWASYLPALLLIALVRRRWLWLVFVLLATLLTKSPTVLLVTTGSVAAWYVLVRKRSATRWLALAGVLAALAVAVRWLHGFGVRQQLSTNLFDQFVGRLASGVRAVTSGGTLGRNERFASTRTIFDELALHDWLWTGIGPGSEGYILHVTDMLPNALPVYVLASFGLVGLALLALLLIKSFVVLRTHSTLVVFLPFTAAAMVNSASGWESYKFVVVAVVVAVTRGGRPR